MKRVFIYGSCVTRDCVSIFPDYGFDMVGYVARQSLISAFNPAKISEYDLSSIGSSFQRRMTKYDIESSMFDLMVASKPDLVIWDLCDERLGVVRPASGGFVTWSRNFKKEGLHVATGAFVGPYRFGGDEHFEMWAASFLKFCDSLRQADLFDRVVLNGTSWATVNEQGLQISGDSSAAFSFNEDIQRYVELVVKQGMRVAEVADGLTVANTEHQWGEAPFHYTENTYVAMMRSITEAMSR